MEISNRNWNVNAYRTEGKDNSNKVEQTIDNSSFDIRVENLESNIIGFGYWNTADGNSYEITASYGDDYSEENPVIKVRVKTSQEVEEHLINIKTVDPRNAKDLEMFALCVYADATGKGADSTSSNWAMLNYHINNAGRSDDSEMSGIWDVGGMARRNWTEMVHSAMNSYMNSSMYQQAMDSGKLLNLFNSHVDEYFNSDKEKESEDKGKEVEESKTDTEIVVKPDGSRVLVVTTNVFGMSTTTSLKISESTKLPNESGKAEDILETEQDEV